MAAAKKTTSKKTESKKTESKGAAADKPAYGVNELCEALGVEPASARVALRKHGIEKSGRSYGWNTKKELDAVVKTIKAGASEEKPAAKKAPAKKAAKKSA